MCRPRVHTVPVKSPEQQGVLALYRELHEEVGLRPEHVEIMGRGYAWLDTGTHESLLEAGQFIATLEKRQGLKIACPEEIAYRMGYIAAAQVRALARPLRKTGYGRYLLKVLEEDGWRE